MRIITATVNAFLTDANKTPGDLMEMAPEMAVGVGGVSYYAGDMSGVTDWFRVGRATITVELDDDPKVIERLIDSIDAQIKKADADHEMRRNALIGKKQSLLAIEYKQPDPETEGAEDGLPDHKRSYYMERMFDAADSARKEQRENAA